jgi:hypothetical protein
VEVSRRACSPRSFDSAGFAVEDVIGADVQAADVLPSAEGAYLADGGSVDAHGFLFVRLAVIDVGEGGAIYQYVKGEWSEHAVDFTGLAEIDIGAGEGHDFVGRGPGTGKSGAEAAAGSEDGDFHGTNFSHHWRLARYQSMVAGRAWSMR